MDGKSVTGAKSSVLNLADTIKPGKKAVRTEDSNPDRDADGRRERQKQSNKELSEDQRKQALKKISELPGFVKNNLTVHLENGKIVIKDFQLNIVRRFDESELWHFLEENTSTKGQLFKKKA